MYGDLLASQTPGNLTVTFPGQSPQVLTRGQEFIPQLGGRSAIPAGTVFNFDTFLANGTRIVAGTPYPVNDPLTNRTPEIIPLFDSSHSSSSSRSAGGVVALLSRGTFKITENESPRPLNRVYGAFNFFNNVNSRTDPNQTMNVYREVFGFEKTFLHGRGSVGFRQPGIQTTGAPGIKSNGFGDLTGIVKYAVYDNRETRNLMSVGLNVTVPSGANFLPPGVVNLDSVILQPWVGGIYNIGNVYIQGFNAYAIPTKSADVTLMFNDIGIGYMMFRNPEGRISFVAPTFEAHLTTPLSKRDVFPGLDILNFTYGTTFGIGNRAWLNLGVAHPVTGPHPFSLETIAQLNVGF